MIDEKQPLGYYVDKIAANEDMFNNFVSALRGGETQVLHNVVSQALELDDTWIITLEGAIHSIEQIVRNPRKFIAENDLVVDVAKARKVGPKTVRHLTQHSQFVQNIDKDGNVMPKKLLTVELEEDLAIYENRFIYALVKRLVTFIEQRHRDLDGKLDIYDQTNVCMQSEFNYGEAKFKCDIKMQVQEPPEDRAKLERNNDLFERVKLLRRRLGILQSTEFMKKLSTAKPVRPPIQKTNLLTKNVDYNNCYKLWLFISSYTYLGYSIEVQDKNLPVDGDYFDDLAVISGLSLQSLLNNNVINKEKYASIEFNAPEVKDFKILTNYKYEPSFDDNKAQAGAESINEYYFRKMKDELVKLTAGTDEVVIEKQLNVSFTKFFRSISRINDELYNDLIEQKVAEKENKFLKTAVQKKQQEILQQKERIRRRQLLLKLKWEELERAQRQEERARAKLDKLNKELAEEKEKSKLKVKKTGLKVKTTVKKIKYVKK